MMRMNPAIFQHAEYLEDLKDAFSYFGYDKRSEEKYKAAWELLKNFKYDPEKNPKYYENLYSLVYSLVDVLKILGNYDQFLIKIDKKNILNNFKNFPTEFKNSPASPKEAKSSAIDLSKTPEPKDYELYAKTAHARREEPGLNPFPYPQHIALVVKDEEAAKLILTSRLHECLSPEEKVDAYSAHKHSKEFQKHMIKTPCKEQAMLPYLLLSAANGMNIVSSGSLSTIYLGQGGSRKLLQQKLMEFLKAEQARDFFAKAEFLRFFEAGARDAGAAPRDDERKARADDFSDVDEKLKDGIKQLVKNNVDIYKNLFDCLEKYGLNKADKDADDFYKKVRKAYLKYLAENHPDKRQEAGAGPATMMRVEDKFKEMNLPFIIEEIIKNPRARAYYDKRWENRPRFGAGLGGAR